MVAQFVDVSAYNPASIDWVAYKAWSASGDGISRVAMRSSYGTGYADQHFAAYRAGALAAGIDQIFYYHYAYPQFNQAIAEANWQHGVVGGMRAQDLLVLDIEENVAQATAEWAYEWLAQQEANYGKAPTLYASSAFIQEKLQDSRLARFPLWLANWQYTPDERPPVPAPWSSYEAIQYTDKATGIPGIAGTVDADIYLLQQQGAAMLELNDPVVRQYFTDGGNGMWKCKNGVVLLGGNLTFYRSNGGPALLGLPLTNEIYLPQYPGTAIVPCERAIIIYDPDRKVDNPPIAGPCYLLHIDAGLGQQMIAGPLTDALQAQIAVLKAAQQPTLQAQITQLQAKIAQAQKDLS